MAVYGSGNVLPIRPEGLIMTRQTASPLVPLSLAVFARSAREIARMFSEGDGDLSPEYQRGSVCLRISVSVWSSPG